MSTTNITVQGGGGEEEDKAGLDFYFGRPTEMMRKLESSKPVRRTKIDKKAGPGPDATQNGETSENVSGGYLFKWQKDMDDEPEEEEEDSQMDQAAKSRARWQYITGNLPTSSLSVGAYFEKDGPKGKPLRDGLVNAGGVCMIAPGTSQIKGGKLNLGELSLLNETGKGNFFHDDNVLALRTKDELVNNELDKIPEERLVFRRTTQWPSEGPGFPPPPPDGNEVVQPKKVNLEKTNNTNALVRRLSRVKAPDSKQRLHGLTNTPEHAAMEAAGPGRGALELTGSSFRETGSLSRTRAPSAAALDKKNTGNGSGGGFFRRISFMPGSKKDVSTSFPGIYASYIIVPYMLPPPPQPPKFPAPGSNEERRLQKLNQKRMFLEDLYSQVVELADEKIRLNDICRTLEAQITDSDAQINSLIGANDSV